MKQTFLTLKSEKRNVPEMPVSEFDAWAVSLVDELTGVNRDVWDIFARWRFLNFLICEEVLMLTAEAGGTILLTETEDFSSVLSTKAG